MTNIFRSNTMKSHMVYDIDFYITWLMDVTNTSEKLFKYTGWCFLLTDWHLSKLSEEFNPPGRPSQGCVSNYHTHWAVSLGGGPLCQLLLTTKHTWCVVVGSLTRQKGVTSGPRQGPFCGQYTAHTDEFWSEPSQGWTNSANGEISYLCRRNTAQGPKHEKMHRATQIT